MAAGEPKEDSLLVLGNYEEIKKMVPQHNRLIGWGLVGFGVWALYETFISTWLYTLLCNLMATATPTTSSEAYRMLSLRHC